MTSTAQAPGLDPAYPAHEQEALLLAALVRNSRLSLLYGEAGSDKRSSRISRARAGCNGERGRGSARLSLLKPAEPGLHRSRDPGLTNRRSIAVRACPHSSTALTASQRERPSGYSTTAPKAAKRTADRLQRINCGDLEREYGREPGCTTRTGSPPELEILLFNIRFAPLERRAKSSRA